MRSKYIVELESRNVSVIGLPEKRTLAADIEILGKRTTIFTDIRLTPYAEPDIESIRKEAYDKGFNDGFEDCREPCEDCEERKKTEKEAYARGLNDAWTAAKRLVLGVSYGGFDAYKLIRIFSCSSYSDILRTFTVSEAVEKIKAWEEQDKKEREGLRVGTEIIAFDGQKGVIYRIINGMFWYIRADGTTSWDHPENLKRTDRYFPELKEILCKIGGEDGGEQPGTEI